jgi:hypothetical protein
LNRRIPNGTYGGVRGQIANLFIRYLPTRLEFINTAFVYFNNKVEGFYMPDFGDGLIVAINPEAGIELMKMRNRTKNIAVLPVDNNVALEFLFQNNFKHYRTAKRMTLGEELNWCPEMIFNRVSGQVG